MKKILITALVMMTLNLSASECSQSYHLAKGHLEKYDHNADRKLNENEAVESFDEIADLVMKSTGVNNRNHALAGYLWILKNRSLPKSLSERLSVFKLSNQLKKNTFPSIQASRFSVEAGIRIMYGCDN